MNTESRFYITGGTLPAAAASYVLRKADIDLLEGLRAGEFCYVLDTRQMGKSSLMVRTASRLRETGATILVLDLTAIGQNVTVEQWYDGLLNQTGRELGLEDEIDDFWRSNRHLGPLQRWINALREVALSAFQGPLVVFVDEIDVVRSLPFSTDEFFAAIRECYNLRARHPDYSRLTFCLLGVATQASLVRDTRTTPFNIGRRIDLNDFSASEAAPLAPGLDRIKSTARAREETGTEKVKTTDVPSASADVLLERILYWTGGHPNLTQRLCQAVGEALPDHLVNRASSTIALVDRVCIKLFLTRHAQEHDDNLLFVRDRILRGDVDVATVLDLYSQLRAGVRVRSDDLRPAVTTLLLSGMVRGQGDYLRVRNRIYERVFDRKWIWDRMPDAELRRQRVAYRRGLLRATCAAGVILLGMVVLAMTALRYAQRAERNRLEASVRSSELKIALTARDVALRQLKAALQAESIQHLRADRETIQAREKGRQAAEEREAAIQQKRNAEAQTQQSRERQQRLMITYGSRLMDEGDLSTSLLWLAQAAERETSDPVSRSINRTRIGALLSHLPRLSRLWFNVRSARFSTDGHRVVTANRAGIARVWDSISGTPLSPPLKHGKTLFRATFSPDGHQVLTLGTDGVRVWNSKSGVPLTGLLLHRRSALEAVFSPDGHQIVSGDIGGTVCLWDIRTARALRECMVHGAAAHIEFSPNGRRLVITTGGREGLLLWDMESPPKTLPLDGTIYGAALSPDGKSVVSASDSAAVVVDIATGQPITSSMKHTNPVLCVRFSPDGKRVVTASADCTAQVWDAATGARLTPPLPHGSEVKHICFSADGHYIATASADSTARVWDSVTGEPMTPPLRHTGYVLTVDFDPEGRRLLTLDTSGMARIWDTAGVQMPHRFAGEYGNTACIAYSPDSKRMATGDFDWGARVWNSANGHPLSPLLAHGATVRQVTFSPDGKWLATASDDGTARIWDPVNGRQLVSFLHRASYPHLAFSADSSRLAVAVGNTASIWEAATGKRICVLRGHQDIINSIAFSPDGSRLVTAARDHTARVWHAVTGMSLRLLQHRDVVTSASFSPNRRTVLTASLDQTAQLWDASEGRPILRPLLNEGGVASAAFSADGRLIVTASGPGEARVWDTATGEAIGPPLRHRSAVSFAAFSPTGQMVVTCSRDRTARVWDVLTGSPITPPLLHKSSVRSATFRPDDSGLVTLCDDGVGRVWTLPQDRHSAAQLRQLAELLSAHRLTAGGGLITLEPDAMQHAWNVVSPALREGYGASRAQLSAWHLAEAAVDREAQAWPQCLSHLTWLVSHNPSDRQFRALRAILFAQLGQWSRVTRDNARIDSHPARLIVQEAHRPIRIVTPKTSPMMIGTTRCHQAIACFADNKILVLLPGPGMRFTALAGVGSQGTSVSDGTLTHSVLLGTKEVFHIAGLKQGWPGQPVNVALQGATAFVLQMHHSGQDAYGVWAEGRIELRDGRSFRLSDLPVQPLSGL